MSITDQRIRAAAILGIANVYIPGYGVETFDGSIRHYQALSPDDQVALTNKMLQLNDDPNAATVDMAQATRVEAATRIGITTVDGHPFSGTASDIQKLSQEQQIRLAEETAKLVMANPGVFSAEAVAKANSIVTGANFGKPLEDDSFVGNAVRLASSGDLFTSMFSGAASYLKVVGLIAAAVLVVMFISKNQPRRQSSEL